MCGRYAITTAPEAIRQLFRYLEQPNFPPRYNVAPTQPVPIVRMMEGKRQFALVRWGLIPAWVKDPRTFTLLINARGESVLDKPAFKQRDEVAALPVPGRRLLRMEARGRKEAALFRAAQGRRAAGVRGPVGKLDGAERRGTGNRRDRHHRRRVRSIAHIHDRMPVIVPPEAFDFWLDPKVDAEMAMAVIQPAKDEAIEHYEVSRAVNRTANDAPMLVEPLREPEPVEEAPAPKRAKKEKQDDRQGSLF